MGEMDGFNIHLHGAWATVPHELFILGSATASASHRPEAQSSWGSPHLGFQARSPTIQRGKHGENKDPKHCEYPMIIPINEPLELIHSVSPITALPPLLG